LSGEEDFLKANANTDYMAARLADCLRDCMRAVAADSPDSRRYYAVQNFSMLIRQLKHWENPNLHELFAKAIDHLRPLHPPWDDPRHAVERAYIVAAEHGIKFLTELTSRDTAARGRTSRRQSEFMDAIKWIDEAREERRKHYDRELKEARIGNETPSETATRLARAMIERSRSKPSRPPSSKAKKATPRGGE